MRRENASGDIGLLIARIAVALIALYYGLQKSLGLFGGGGINGTIAFLHDKMGVSAFFAMCSILAESVGALSLLMGFATSIVGVVLFINFSVATYFSSDHFKVLAVILQGTDPSAPPKLFYPLSLALASLALAFTGAGRFSIDARLFRPKRR